jgi:hypothetical protein
VKFYDDVFIGRDNYIARRIETLDNVPINISNLTRCTLEIVDSDPSFIIDSDVEGYDDVFDWETYSAEGLLGLRLGLVQDLPVGFLTFTLVIYSDDFPSGLDNLKPVYFRVWPLSNG